MKKEHIIRAWRDEEYFNSLSEAEREALPGNPAGISELDDKDLRGITGGLCRFTAAISCANPWTVACTFCDGKMCA